MILASALWFAFLPSIFYHPAHASPSSATAPSFESFFGELKRRALDQSPELQAARAIENQKSAQTFTSVSRWLPRLDFQVGQSRGIDYSIVTSGALGSTAGGPAGFPGFSFSPTYVSLSRWALNLNFPIYRRTVHVNLLQSLRERESSQVELGNRLSELDWRLKQLVGSYLLQAYRMASVQTSLGIARTNVREAKLRFELGERTRVDVLRAEANLATLLSQTQGYEQDLVAAVSNLTQYAGLTRSEFSELTGSALERDELALSKLIDRFSVDDSLSRALEPYLDPAHPQALHERISEASPQYRATLASEAVSDARSQSLMAAEWPQLDLTGTLNKQAGNYPDAFQGGNISRSIALTLTIPIFSGGSLLSTYSEKSNAERYSVIQRERDVIRLKDDVENSVVQIRTLRAQLESQSLGLQQGEELVRLSQRSFQLGKTTLLELQTSQNDLLNSKLAFAQSKVNLSVALNRLAWNLGVNP